jgi:hypothetical protein
LCEFHVGFYPELEEHLVEHVSVLAGGDDAGLDASGAQFMNHGGEFDRLGSGAYHYGDMHQVALSARSLGVLAQVPASQ